VTAVSTGVVLAPESFESAATPAETIGASSAEAARAAARAAGAHAFIAELPEGYHTPIGAGGIVLTPAQRLRLGVARLMVQDPPALMIDNPTAVLDNVDEAAVLPGLEALLRGREVAVAAASPGLRAAIARSRGAPGPAPGPAPRPPADVRLPALTRLLDAAEMTPLLSSMIDGACGDVRVHSVRYKPGDNVVVQYDVLTPAGWSTAVAYARAGAGLERKRWRLPNRKLARRAAGRAPAREPFGYLPEVGALVQWLPLDVRLTILCDSADRLTGRLAKKGIVADETGDAELLRYWPRRRAVLRFGPYVLKVYRDRSDFDHARRGLRESMSLTRVRTAPYVGVLKARQTTVQGFLEGWAPSLWPASSELAGMLAANLHADVALELPATTSKRILSKAAVRGAFVGQLLPELRPHVATLMSELAVRRPRGGSPVTSHGNFHAGQLLDSPSGLALLDLDGIGPAAPAYDLASFAAHVAFGRPGDEPVIYSAVDSLVAGYGSRPPDLDWYLAACLLRRAAVLFRFQDQRWPEATTELVRLARAALR